MNNDEMTTAPAPRPRTPRTRFELFELVRDGDELVATGTREQMEWDRDELTAEALADGDTTTVYAVVPADLTDCERGAAGRLCDATTHALHGTEPDERPDHLRDMAA